MQNLVKQWAPFSKKSGSVHSLCITSPIDKSDEVKVVERKDSKTKVLRLRVAEEDLGKVIDKQGGKSPLHSYYFKCNCDQVKTNWRA